MHIGCLGNITVQMCMLYVVYVVNECIGLCMLVHVKAYTPASRLPSIVDLHFTHATTLINHKALYAPLLHLCCYDHQCLYVEKLWTYILPQGGEGGCSVTRMHTSGD